MNNTETFLVQATVLLLNLELHALGYEVPALPFENSFMSPMGSD